MRQTNSLAVAFLFCSLPRANLGHAPVVVEVPAEVEVLDADAGGVGTRQEHRGAVHGLDGGDFTCGHLQGAHSPHAWKQGRGTRIRNDLQTRINAM